MPNSLFQTNKPKLHIAFAKAKAGSSGDANKEDKNMTAKRAALDGVLQKIERSYGHGSIVKLGDADKMLVEFIVPMWRWEEAIPKEESPKFTVRNQAVRQLLHSMPLPKHTNRRNIVDAEHALGPLYAGKLIVDVDKLTRFTTGFWRNSLNVVDQLVQVQPWM